MMMAFPAFMLTSGHLKKKVTVLSKYWTHYKHVMIPVWQHYYNSMEAIYLLQIRLAWYASNSPFYPFKLCVWLFPGMWIAWKQGREARGEAAGCMQQILHQQSQLWSFCPLLFLCSSYIKCSVLTSPRGGILHPHPPCILSQVKRAWTLGFPPTVV